MSTLALQLGLGLAFWPALFLWTSLLGWRWTPATVRLVTLVIAGAGLFTLFTVSREQWYHRYQHLRKHATAMTTFAAVLVLSVITRWMHIRDLALPNWVDSVHHMMLLRLILDRGAVPYDYAPFIEETARPLYHWGYHALVAWPAWLLGTTDPFRLAELMLHTGQALNVLMAPALYAAGRALFESRRIGLLVATLGMLVSWFPAYYVSWGRYTHLAGLLIAIPFAIVLWRLHQAPSRGNWIAAALLGAGLMLVHVRVAFFTLVFALVLAGALLVRREWKTLTRWGTAGLATLLVTTPWLQTLAASRYARALISPSTQEDLEAWTSYNAIPWHLVWIPQNHELLSLATGGITGLAGWGDAQPWLRVASAAWMLLLIGLLVLRWRRLSSLRTLLRAGPWSQLLLLAGWLALTTLLLNLDHFGLPPLAFAHNAAAVITLFLPISLAGGSLLAWVIGAGVPKRWHTVAAVLLVLVIGTWGARDMTDVVNPTTILARPADVRALRWIDENTPADAKFAVNVWRWQGDTYAGSDGGYWIEVLTDRDSIMPPALYTTVAPPDTIRRINNLLDHWHKTETLDDPAMYRRLRNAGVTHLYVGPRGGHLKPAQLRESSFVRLVYENDGSFVFELVEEG